MKQPTLTYSLADIDKAVNFLYPLFEQKKVITFTGSIGAGKTTIIQKLLQKLGIQEPIQSPTFSYYNRYHTKLVADIFHFDLYRLSSEQDFINLGFDEYLYKPNSVALIEWPEIIMPLLTHDVCHVTIDYDGFSARKIFYTVV